MMPSQSLLSIALVAATAVGCGATAPSRFYTLDSTATASGTPTASYAVAVGPVSIPPAVDRPQFVVQVAPNRVELDEFNRWAAPLDDSIVRVVVGDLVALLGTADVTSGPIANVSPAYQVTIDVQRFESVQGKEVLLEALWAVRATADGAVRSGRTVSREAASDQSFDALAAAHSRGLAKLSTEIAAAIQAAESAR